jgi:hypothetical protein
LRNNAGFCIVMPKTTVKINQKIHENAGKITNYCSAANPEKTNNRHLFLKKIINFVFFNIRTTPQPCPIIYIMLSLKTQK